MEQLIKINSELGIQSPSTIHTVLLVTEEESVYSAIKNSLNSDLYNIVWHGQYGFHSLCKREAAETIVKSIIKQSGRLDALIWAPLRMFSLPWNKLTIDDFDKGLEHYVHAAFYYSRAAMHPMLRQRSGRLLFLTSSAALVGEAADPLYSIVSGCLHAFVKSIAREEAKRGITANAVCIGTIEDCEFMNSPVVKRWTERYCPLKKPVNLTDMGNTFAWLLSSEARHINGQLICIDRGTR